MTRISNLVTFNILRRTTKPTTINNYFLPKNTTIVPQISAVLYNEKVYFNTRKLKSFIT